MKSSCSSSLSFWGEVNKSGEAFFYLNLLNAPFLKITFEVTCHLSTGTATVGQNGPVASSLFPFPCLIFLLAFGAKKCAWFYGLCKSVRFQHWLPGWANCFLSSFYSHFLKTKLGVKMHFQRDWLPGWASSFLFTSSFHFSSSNLPLPRIASTMSESLFSHPRSKIFNFS